MKLVLKREANQVTATCEGKSGTLSMKKPGDVVFVKDIAVAVARSNGGCNTVHVLKLAARWKADNEVFPLEPPNILLMRGLIIQAFRWKGTKSFSIRVFRFVTQLKICARSEVLIDVDCVPQKRR